VLLDIDNIGIAVGNMLLSCVQAEIYVISYLLPVLAQNTLGAAAVKLDQCWDLYMYRRSGELYVESV